MNNLTGKIQGIRQGDGNNVYGNLVVTNNTSFYQPMDIEVNRGDEILKNANDYYMSIIRFSIPTGYLPLFFLDLVNTPLEVTMAYNGVSHTVQLVYDNILSSLANTQNPLLPPYGIWTYLQFVNMINVAIQAAHDFLFPPVNAKKAPYMIFDPVTQLFSMIADNSYIEPSPYINPLVEKLFFNNNLNNLFNNFFGVRDPYVLNSLFQFIFQNTNNNSITTRDSLAGVEMKQEYTTLTLLNSVTNITIESNSFPVASEYQYVSSITDTTFNDDSRKILTDFEINYTNERNAGESRSLQQYQATIYRYIDMKGSSELRNFTLSIYAYLADSNKYLKLFLIPGQTLSMKILFKRKGINY
jgi:hypothetical protein